MGNVTGFIPNAQALENVPHMLRYWANVIERAENEGTKVELAAIILTEVGDPKPAFYIAGAPHDEPHHPLYVAGVFDYCRAELVGVIQGLRNEE